MVTYRLVIDVEGLRSVRLKIEFIMLAIALSSENTQT